MKFFKVFLLTALALIFATTGTVSAKKVSAYKSAIKECTSGKYKAKFQLVGKQDNKNITIKDGKKLTIERIRFRFLPETNERNNNKLKVSINTGRKEKQTYIGCDGTCWKTKWVPVWKVIEKDNLARNGRWNYLRVNFKTKKGQQVYFKATFDKPLWDKNCGVSLRA